MIILWLTFPTGWRGRRATCGSSIRQLHAGPGAARRSLKEILFRPRPPAVCVPTGARLRLRDIPEDLQRRYAVGAVEEVTFVQKSAEAFIHRDAVRFANGQDILLQRLRCGQRVDVLSLCV